MDGSEVESFYRRYAAWLNDARGEALGEFVHDALAYNGEPITIVGYRQLIADGFAAIADLRFDIGNSAPDRT